MGAFPAARLRHSGVFRARAREITSLLQVLFKSVVIQLPLVSPAQERHPFQRHSGVFIGWSGEANVAPVRRKNKYEKTFCSFAYRTLNRGSPSVVFCADIYYKLWYLSSWFNILFIHITVHCVQAPCTPCFPLITFTDRA